MQRRSHRSLHSEDEPVTVRTPSKRISEIERADARAIPAPPSQKRAARARRQSPKPRQPEFDDDDDADEGSARSAVTPAAAVAHTPRRQRSSGDDAAVATPASPSRSSRVAQPAASDAAAEDDDTEALRASTRFQLLRSVLLLVIFLLLYTLTQRYLLEPTFQPHRSDVYKRAQEAKLRAQIAANVCPAGQECEFELKQDFQLGQRGER